MHTDMGEHMAMLRACNARWVPRDEKRLAAGVAAAVADLRAVRMLSGGASISEAVSSLRTAERISPADGKALAEHSAWERISAAFVPGHSALECRVAWGRSFLAGGDRCPAIRKGTWTAAEDERLVSAINNQLQRQMSTLDWRDVAAHVGRRSAAQCAMRWHKSLDPRLRLGPWSPAEDEMLRAAVARVGQDTSRAWRRVAAWVSTASAGGGMRSDVQCRERWASVSSGMRSGAWSTEEDARLADAVAMHGAGSWAAVSRDVGTRSDSQCRRRHARLAQ